MVAMYNCEIISLLILISNLFSGPLAAEKDKEYVSTYCLATSKGLLFLILVVFRLA